MDKKNKNSISPAVIPICGLFAFFGIMFFLYQQSRYLPFLLGGVFFLLLGVVNFILFLFKQDEPTLAENNSNTIQKESDSQENISVESKKASFFKRILTTLSKIPKKLKTEFDRRITLIQCIFLSLALVGCGVYFAFNAFKPLVQTKFEYWHLIVLVVLFVCAIIFDKYCKHSSTSDSFTSALLKNARAFFTLVKLFVLVICVTIILSMFNIIDIHKYTIYFFAALYYYITAMIIISLSVRIIKKELSSNPTIIILLPFMASDAKELSVISFLEDNTGITLRSLWSIKYVKKILPVAILITFFLFWLSTGIVYVESYQKAVVYRFGTMQEEILEPGLHITLPYPIDKSKIYDTEKINKITIGYKSEENVDNVWTKDHGNSEYKLLLGSGDELVSLNLRIEYKINDLKKYLQSATNPAKILEAKAYELTTSRTINTDLYTLLSVNRDIFAKEFNEDLKNEFETTDTGIEIVGVIMESIHPPVDVAEVYQEFIGVGIDSERIIIEAESQAIVLKFEAESTKESILNQANANYYSRLAEARTSVSSFVAALDAYENDPDAYVYYKYLDAISSAYKKSNLVILGEGIDGSRIYWGSFDPLS